jgi:hypothetical protein
MEVKKTDEKPPDITRREVLKTMAAGAIAATLGDALSSWTKAQYTAGARLD